MLGSLRRMTKAELLRTIAADMDAEYARIELRRKYDESAASQIANGRQHELAWWAAHLRGMAEDGGEHRPPVGTERRTEA